MPYISNPIFSEVEKANLEFVLRHNFPKKRDVINQLNHMKEADITRDVTPFYWIMEFRPNGINPGHGPMHRCINIVVSHGSEASQTVFALYERNGFVFELEIYNADSSAMNLDTITDGEMIIYLNE